MLSVVTITVKQKIYKLDDQTTVQKALNANYQWTI